jgi:hypothetical protein
MPAPETTEGIQPMEPYWTNSAKELLDMLGGSSAHQEWVLSNDSASIRRALKDSRFEGMEERELQTIIATAMNMVRRKNAKAV